MPSTDSPVGTVAALLQAVQAQTEKVDTFKDEQIALYTAQTTTVIVTDAHGNPVTVPSWNYLSTHLGGTPAPSPAPTPAPTGGGADFDFDIKAQEFNIVASMDDISSYYTSVNASGIPGQRSLSPAVMSNGNEVVKPALNSAAVVEISNRLPSSGKYWFSVDISGLGLTSGPGTNNGIDIEFVSSPTVTPPGVYNPSSPDGYDMLNESPVGMWDSPLFLARLWATAHDWGFYGIGIYGTVHNVNTTGTLQFLVTVDIDESEISIYDATGLLGTLPVYQAASTGISFLASSKILGNLTDDITAVGDDGYLAVPQLRLNTTDPTQAPFLPPDGFRALYEILNTAGEDEVDEMGYDNAAYSLVFLDNQNNLLGGFSAGSGDLYLPSCGFVGRTVNDASMATTTREFDVVPRYLLTLEATGSASEGGSTSLAIGAGFTAFDTFEIFGRNLMGEFDATRPIPASSINLCGCFDFWKNAGSGSYWSFFGKLVYYSDVYSSRDSSQYVVSHLSRKTLTAVACSLGALPMYLTVNNNLLAGYTSGSSTDNLGAYVDVANWTAVTGVSTFDGNPTVPSYNDQLEVGSSLDLLALEFTDSTQKQFFSPIVSVNKSTGTYVTQPLPGWLNGTFGALYCNGAVIDFAEGNQPWGRPDDLPVQPGTPFVVDTSQLFAPSFPGQKTGLATATVSTDITTMVLVVALGYYDLTDTNTMKRDINAIMAKMRSVGNEKVVFLSPMLTSGTSSPSAAQAYMENWLEFNYPNNSINLRRSLIGSNATISGTYYTGTTSLSDAGVAAISTIINDFLIRKGW